jgi:hypothetical protein
MEKAVAKIRYINLVILSYFFKKNKKVWVNLQVFVFLPLAITSLEFLLRFFKFLMETLGKIKLLKFLELL